MRLARTTAVAAAAGSVVVSLLVASSPSPAAPGDGPRIAYTDDRDLIEQVVITREDDSGGSTYDVDFPETGPAWEDTEHQGELSGSSDNYAYVSTYYRRTGEVVAYTYNDLEGGSLPRRLTCNRALETHPVVINEGVAWATDIDGDWNIYHAYFDGDTDTRVGGTCPGWNARQITTDPADDLWPAFNSSGSRIVFSSTREDPLGDLWSVNVDDSVAPEEELQQLTSGPAADSTPAVSRVGVDEWVFYTSTQQRQDGTLRVLQPGEFGDPVPDNYQLWDAGDGIPQASEPALTPGSSTSGRTYLAFTSTSNDPYGDIEMGEVLPNEDSDQPVLLVDQEPVADRTGLAETHPAWYTDFTTFGEFNPYEAVVTFTARDINANVSDVREDGSDERVLANEVVDNGKFLSTLDEAGPSWSPDGTQIAYSRTFDDETGRELVIADSDGSNPAAIPIDREEGDVDLDPVWSPDGTRIAFTRYEDNQDGGYFRPAVYVVDIDGGTPTVLTDRSTEDNSWMDSDPTWSPDSAYVVVERSDGFDEGPNSFMGPDVTAARDAPRISSYTQSSLWALDASGSLVDYRLRFRRCDTCDTEPVYGRSPAWSPDGSRVAFITEGALRTVQMEPSPSFDMWPVTVPSPVTGFDGASPTPSRDTISWADDPAWSPEGDEIAFAGQPAGQPDQRGIYVIRPNGNGLRTVVDGRGPETEPAWVQGRADVSVTVSISGSPAAPGDTVTATYTVRNNGPGVATEVTLSTTFPPGGTRSASSPPPGCRPNGSGCNFGSLADGQTRQYEVELTYPDAVEGDAEGSVSTTTFDPDLTNNEDSAPFRVTSVDVKVRVSLDGPTGWVGGTREATIRVKNVGSEPAEDVELELVYPPDILAPDSADPCLEGTAPCLLGDLAGGERQVFTVPLEMLEEGDGTIEATVATTGPDSNLANNVHEVDIEVLQPTIRLLPAVARPGMVTMAYGENMPPRTRVRLRWRPGITVNRGPFRVARDGTMRAPLLLVRRDQLGSRELKAVSTTDKFSPVTGPMLIVQRLATAPDFLARG